MEQSSFAIARFKGDRLTKCVAADVIVRRQPGAGNHAANGVGPQKLALVLADEGEALDGDSELGGLGNERYGAFVGGLANGDTPFIDAKDTKSKAELSHFVEELRKQEWGVTAHKEAIKKGELAQVPSCKFPDRTPLGQCALGGSWEAPGFDGVTWKIGILHFDVGSTIDSDSAMKTCLKVGGKWTAADNSDPNVFRERMHQHTGALRDIVHGR
jgi:hypothetical protein